MAKFITAAEAAALIKDGDTLGIGGQGLAGWAEEIGLAIRDRFKETGHPRDLTLRQGCALGDWKDRGITHLGEAGEGLVTRWSGAHIGSAFALNALALEISFSVTACLRVLSLTCGVKLQQVVPALSQRLVSVLSLTPVSAAAE